MKGAQLFVVKLLKSLDGFVLFDEFDILVCILSKFDDMLAALSGLIDRDVYL